MGQKQQVLLENLKNINSLLTSQTLVSPFSELKSTTSIINLCVNKFPQFLFFDSRFHWKLA